jgi:hypothetical protein
VQLIGSLAGAGRAARTGALSEEKASTLQRKGSPSRGRSCMASSP